MSRDAVVLAAESLVGLSWGDPQTRRRYSRLLAPWDSPERADQMASAQSSCALTILAALLIAEVDGLVRGIRGLPVADPLRSPRWQRYDSLPYLETLALQRGLHRKATSAPPEVLPGTWLMIGGSAALGGEAHVLMATSAPDADGRILTVEGGQVDVLNPRTGAEKCTAIGRRVRQLVRDGSVWRVGSRVLRYTCDAGALPTVRDGMPWAQIGETP